MSAKKTIKGRGGKRPGAGRKAKHGVAVVTSSISMIPEAWDLLDAQREAVSQGEWIFSLILKSEILRNLLLSSFAKQMEEKDAKLAAIAKLPEKWREENSMFCGYFAQELEAVLASPPAVEPVPEIRHDLYDVPASEVPAYHTPGVVQQRREDAAAINAVMNPPAPAGKLTDGQLVEIGAKAGLATGEHSSYYKAFAAAVAAEVRRECEEELAEAWDKGNQRATEADNLRTENAKQAEEIARMAWRPVSVKPTAAEADAEGTVFVCSADGRSRGIHRITWPFGTGVTHWFPFPKPPPAPTNEESEREAFEAAYESVYTHSRETGAFEREADGNYKSTIVRVSWNLWQARASKEVKA